MTYEQLKTVFAAFRASFSNFSVTRQAIVEDGDLVAARTTMSGIFTAGFETPFGLAAPTGQHVEWQLNNVFRYDSRGHLAEEWVQYDTLGFFGKLGIDLVARTSGK